MCQRECQCVICEMEKQGVILSSEEEMEERINKLFREFEQAGLGS